MKIQDILNQSKPYWKYAAMDSNFKWYLYTMKPFRDERAWRFIRGKCGYVEDFFDVEPFDGDWKDSLIERGR